MREAFEEARSRVAAGVTVVYARLGKEERGMTATAFMSLSLEPPLVALGIHETARILPLLEASRAFTVSVLRAGQEAASQHFAGRPQEGAGLVDGRVDGPLAALRFRLATVYPGGALQPSVGRAEAAELGEPGP
ncbi:MFS transporter, partial [Thermus scotoductus]|uniref:flavin reductase family protein n=1 Tax=Thermus scotoductus TaxID=37636 RepID=UPI0010032647